MLIIYTGHGKGKTTAAIGQAVRAIGQNAKVLMVQFIKGPWISGEDHAAKRLAPDFLLVKKGKGFVGILNDTLPREVHVEAAVDGLAYAKTEAMSGKWNVVILDEVWNALFLKLLTAEAVADFIATVEPAIDLLVMTGRDCPQEFMDKADIVTEMREIKHVFRQGVQGKKVIEF